MPHHKHYDWEYSYEIFVKNIKNTNLLMLDVGCGNGEKASIFKSSVSGLVGIDLSMEFLKKACNRGLEVVLGDAGMLPFQNEAFDVITCFHVLEHVDNGLRVVKEIFRVLKNGSFFLLVTPNSRRITSIFTSLVRFLTRSRSKYPFNPDHVFEYTDTDLHCILSKCFGEYHIIPVFLGVMTRFSDIGLKIPPKILLKYCNQWMVLAKK